MRGLSEGVTGLKSETGNLVSALRRPQTRGSWGEMQLRRAIEMAGMLEHCDFVEQHTINGSDGRLRPDVIIRMPADKVVVVDSKVPLDGYLSAIEATDDGDRALHLTRHARQVRDHVNKLASKNYARELESPELVVMFLPAEGIYHAALQEDASLLEYGPAQHVLIATPTTLIALLQAIYFGWQQERIAESARDIAAAGTELHQRVGVFLGAFHKVGRQLGQRRPSVQRGSRLDGGPRAAVAAPHRRVGRRLRARARVAIADRRLAAARHRPRDRDLGRRGAGRARRATGRPDRGAGPCRTSLPELPAPRNSPPIQLTSCHAARSVDRTSRRRTTDAGGATGFAQPRVTVIP